MMKRMLQKLMLLLAFFVVLPTVVYATPGIMKLFVAQYPDTAGSQLDSCRTCHLPAEKDCLNVYAQAVKEKSFDFKALEELDSDSDGRTNLEEIKDKQLPGSQAGEDELFVFTARMGNVTFNHEKHSLDEAYRTRGKCENCHTQATFPRKFDDNAKWQKIAHIVCKNCHKEAKTPNAPTKCKECHIKK